MFQDRRNWYLLSNLITLNSQFPGVITWNAVGLSLLDYEEFVMEEYFKDGNIYIDEDKKTYKALNFTSKGFFSAYGMLNPSLYIAGYQASKQGITGNLKGDGLQLGGTIICEKNGKVIYSHIQSSYTDFPKEEDISKIVKNYINK